MTWNDNIVAAEQATDGPELMRYRAVRKKFGWKTNFNIRKLVDAGVFVRKRVAPHVQGLRITRESVEAYWNSLNNEEETRKFFEVSKGDWEARKAAAKRDKKIFGDVEDAASRGTVVPDSQIVHTEIGPMASCDYMDVLSRRVIPAGCYVDVDESLVAGQIAPCFAERIFKERCRRRGIKTGNPKYVAEQISEAIGQYYVKVNQARSKE
jgi:hypothetical protein